MVLTPDNFDDVVDGSVPAFVEFYAPWCGHCKNLAPEYEKVGASYSKADGVIVAKVDADAHKDLASRFGVRGFPTLKWFNKDPSDPEDYSGGRSAEDIIEFINERTGLRKRVKTEPSSVMHLDTSSFDAIVKDPAKSVLVEFYAPWCGHCKALKPTYEEVARTFEFEDSVVVAAVDATKHSSLAEEYGVSGYPTIKFFPAGEDKEAQPYQGARDGQAFVDFLNGAAGTQRKLGGGLTSDAGRVAELADLVSGFLAREDKAAALEEAKEIAKDLVGDAARNAKLHVKAMQKIIDKGAGYVDSEIRRLTKMAASSAVSGAKKSNFMLRRNVLQFFKGAAEDEE